MEDLKVLLNNRSKGVRSFREDLEKDIRTLYESEETEFLWLTRPAGTVLVPIPLPYEGQKVVEYYLKDYDYRDKVKAYIISKPDSIKKISNSEALKLNEKYCSKPLI
jgi:hypothetical protein